MKLSKNFTLNEFTHSQMAIEQGILNEPDAEQREAIQQLVDHLLQPLRERVGEAMFPPVSIPRVKPPIVIVLQVRNTCCKSYSTVACHLIRRLFISGNASCIFRIGKDDAGRWCCINRREEPLTFRTIPGFQTRHLYTTFSRRYSRHKAVLRLFL